MQINRKVRRLNITLVVGERKNLIVIVNVLIVGLVRKENKKINDKNEYKWQIHN
jgi:hypothetical protein